jgi:hypothetical protein
VIDRLANLHARRTIPYDADAVEPWGRALDVTPGSVHGRAADRADGRLPVLEPGEERVTRVQVRVAPR